MNAQSLIIILSVTTVLACHKGVDRVEVPANPTLATANFMSNCDEKTKSFRDKTNLTEEKTTTVNIERQFQRVIVKDCSGAVTSDSMQKVQSPRANVELSPERRLSRKAANIRLFNSETCADDSQALPTASYNLWNNLLSITGTDSGYIKVKMDMSEAWFTFKVTSGWNHVYYSYSDTEEIASGVYNVYVNYTEKTLPGVTVREAQDCTKAK